MLKTILKLRGIIEVFLQTNIDLHFLKLCFMKVHYALNAFSHGTTLKIFIHIN